MITIQIDLSKPGNEELSELLNSYVAGDSIMMENVEGRVSSASPDHVEIEVENLDLEDYMYEVPSRDE
tara:strand:+ start:1033 stop:1236 length:204 start_codon:yes stop_codon:yes gene_type:complete